MGKVEGIVSEDNVRCSGREGAVISRKVRSKMSCCLSSQVVNEVPSYLVSGGVS